MNIWKEIEKKVRRKNESEAAFAKRVLNEDRRRYYVLKSKNLEPLTRHLILLKLQGVSSRWLLCLVSEVFYAKYKK